MYAVAALEARKVGILHFMEPAQLPDGLKPLAPEARKRFSGTFIINVGYDRDTGEQAIASGLADAVAFGTLFISNPDLPERFRCGPPWLRPILPPTMQVTSRIARTTRFLAEVPDIAALSILPPRRTRNNRSAGSRFSCLAPLARSSCVQEGNFAA
jgi:hypothetical protein